MVYTHQEERLEFLSSLGLKGTTDLEEALSVPHGGVVVASGPKGLPELLEKLSARKELILSETSFLTLESETNARLKSIEGYALEQYLHTPLFSSVWALLPLIGKVDQLRLSMLHNHHAASIVRHLFPDWKEGVITGEDYSSHTIKTGSRAGREYGGEKEDYTRKIRIMKGPDWLFLQDFSTNMYRSYLIPSTF
ncbi:MAG: hypothetical protein KBS81_03055 [Spirochaetales bacterium]|nr:hypothetical protein [Candidatus Physcosoma equi]